VAIVPVRVDGYVARLVSVYSPSKPTERRGFVSALSKGAKVRLQKSDIVMGDFNCVPDIILDTHGDAEYANIGGRATEAMLASAGLQDIYRLYHGNARSYTRKGSTQFTRLDRLYAQKYDSPWRWTTVEHDSAALEGRYLSSDHSAVIATFEAPCERGSTKFEERIDPTVYRDEEVKCMVRKLWRGTYDGLAGHEEGHKWYKAKLAVGKYLLDETRDRRKKNGTMADSIRLELKALDAKRDKEGPTERGERQEKELRKQLQEEVNKEKPPSQWWLTLRRCGRR